MTTITIGEGAIVSIFSMVLIFIILLLLAYVIALLKKIPGVQEPVQQVVQSEQPTQRVTAVQESDEEERMVAMLVASCLAKEQYKNDVQVISCERIK